MNRRRHAGIVNTSRPRRLPVPLMRAEQHHVGLPRRGITARCARLIETGKVIGAEMDRRQQRSRIARRRLTGYAPR